MSFLLLQPFLFNQKKYKNSISLNQKTSSGRLEHCCLVCCVQDVVQGQFAGGPTVGSDGGEALTGRRGRLGVTGHCVHLTTLVIRNVRYERKIIKMNIGS